MPSKNIQNMQSEVRLEVSYTIDERMFSQLMKQAKKVILAKERAWMVMRNFITSRRFFWATGSLWLYIGIMMWALWIPGEALYFIALIFSQTFVVLSIYFGLKLNKLSRRIYIEKIKLKETIRAAIHIGVM